MRISLLTTVYSPDPTGTSVYATALAEHLVGCGHRVEVTTTLPHYPQWEIRPEYRRKRRVEETIDGVAVRRNWLYVPRRQSLLRRAAYEGSFLAHTWLTTRLRRHAPDLVIAIVPNVANGLLGWWWARRAGVPLVLMFQDLSGPGAAESGMQGGHSVVEMVSRVETAVARRAAVVTICSEAFRDRLEAAGVRSESIVFFPNWSRLPNSSSERAAERARRGWCDEDRIVLHAGNLGLKQRMTMVADYAAEAARRGTHLRFVMVGDGSQRQEIQRATAGMSNVEYIPPVPEDELPELLAAADVLFLHERPGLREMSVPSKLTAYFSAGRPVVAAVEANGPAAKLVLDAGGGVVTPAGDPATLVSVLDELTQDPKRMACMGASARAFAEKELTQRDAMALFDDVVRRATRRAGAPE